MWCWQRMDGIKEMKNQAAWTRAERIHGQESPSVRQTAHKDPAPKTVPRFMCTRDYSKQAFASIGDVTKFSTDWNLGKDRSLD